MQQVRIAISVSVLFYLIQPAMAASATDHWIGPGWYDVENSPFGPALIAGPYVSKQQCLSTPCLDKGEQCVYYPKDPNK